MHRGTQRVLLVVIAVAAAAAVVLALRPGGSGGRRVVLYTAHAQDAIDLLVPRLLKDTGLEAEVIPAGSGEVVQRLRAEKDRPRCDVVFGLAGDQLEGCADLLAEHTPAEVERLVPAFRVGTRWQPYTALLLVLMVNTERLPAEQAPKSWADLTLPHLRGRISSARADTSGSAYMQLRTMLQVFGGEVGGEAGWEAYGRFLQNVSFAPGSAAVPRLVNDGEAAVGVTLEDSALRYVRGGGPVRIVYPSEGTVAAPDGIGLVAGAPHPEDARVFIDWALSKPIQDLLAEKLGRRSARTDAAPLANLPTLEELKTLPYDFARAASEKEPTIARWTKLVSELGR